MNWISSFHVFMNSCRGKFKITLCEFIKCVEDQIVYRRKKTVHFNGLAIDLLIMKWYVVWKKSLLRRFRMIYMSIWKRGNAAISSSKAKQHRNPPFSFINDKNCAWAHEQTICTTTDVQPLLWFLPTTFHSFCHCSHDFRL